MAEVDATRACVVCGTLFARNGKVSLCSDECRATRQREHMRASALRNGYIKGPQQLTCAHCGAPFVGPTNKTFCSVKCKDAERRKTPAYARDQAKWRDNNRDVIRARQKQYSSRVRAGRGRGDRSGEYAVQRTRRLGPTLAAMLWLDVRYYAAHVEALAMNAEFDRAARARRAANRGLVEADKWRWKYRNDPEFRQAQLQRLKAQKIKRKKRTEFSMTKAEVLAVYAERSSCLYCGCRLDSGSKVLDHMDPLSKGGAHDASNLVVACAKCNTRKSAKLFVDWLPHVTESRRAMVAKVYAKKHGAPAEQCGLMLVMKAA